VLLPTWSGRSGSCSAWPRPLKVCFDGGDEDDYSLAWLSHGHPEAPHNEGQAWLWFDSAINKALEPYHASVKTYLGGTLTGATPMLTLYRACARQLHDYIAEGTPFARCANERCP